VIRHVYDYRGVTLLRKEEAQPVCGEDFCDDCGDCLACYAEDICPYDRLHVWRVYEDEDA